MWGMPFVFVSNKSGSLKDSSSHTNLKIFGAHPGPIWGLIATRKPPLVLYLALLRPTFELPNHFFTDTPLKCKFNSRTCNSKPKWNKKKCLCECKNCKKCEKVRDCYILRTVLLVNILLLTITVICNHYGKQKGII